MTQRKVLLPARTMELSLVRQNCWEVPLAEVSRGVSSPRHTIPPTRMSKPRADLYAHTFAHDPATRYLLGLLAVALGYVSAATTPFAVVL
jgi:hypothetical protein